MITSDELSPSAMYANFRQKSLGILSRLRPLADSCYQPRILAAEKRLSNDRIKVLVLGEFSRGKSTFINALLGEPLLPSRVTPTTAAITTIRGSDSRTIEVRHEDGSSKILPLPEVNANRHLLELVTQTNHVSSPPSDVIISLPCRLNRSLIDIVDTPGVNDLNKLREEITFKYLSECDLALILLDSHQPLTESERSFLKTRVIAADVNKLIFVMNRIDEKAADGDDFSLDALIASVKRRLSDELGIVDPKVFAISALQALKGRYRNEDNNPYMKHFESFEEYFLRFANQQATTHRSATHKERLQRILLDIVITIENSCNALEMDQQQQTLSLSKLSSQLSDGELAMKNLPVRLEEEMLKMKQQLISDGASDLQARKADFQNKVATVTSIEAFDGLQADLRTSLRKWSERLAQRVHSQSTTIANSIRQSRPELFSTNTALLTGSSQILGPASDSEMTLSFDPVIAKSSNLSSADMIVGALFALVSTVMFGGPLPMLIAAIFGAGISKNSRNSTALEEAIQLRKKNATDALNKVFLNLESKLISIVDELANHQSSTILSCLRERADNTLSHLRRSIEMLQKAANAKEAMRVARLHEMREQRELIKQLLDDSQNL
jgi:GTPase Era involved in 16S rRNA processing